MAIPIGSNISVAQSEKKIVDPKEHLPSTEQSVPLVSLMLVLQIAASVSASSPEGARSSKAAHKAQRYSAAPKASYSNVSKAAQPCFHRQHGGKR